MVLKYTISMKTFIQHDFPKLERIDSDNGRLYKTPSGVLYPSVTSVLSYASKDSIQEWKDAVGHEEANLISKRAANRGTAIHDLCERYLKSEQVKPSMFDVELFNAMKLALTRIDNVHALETQMYSDHLQVAGTVDCIAEFDGKLSIIDFKTSARAKSHDEIHSYFAQTSVYAVMFEELTGIPVNRLVIIMGVDGDKNPSLFIEKRDKWIGKFIELRKEFRQWKNC